MDTLTKLLAHFSLHAGVFYTGNICGVHDYAADDLRGHIHLVKHGPVQVIGERNAVISITEPSILFLPRPDRHRLITDERAGADVVCATVRFGGGGRNPINDSLPNVVLVRLAELPKFEELLALMFDEAFSDHCGRQAVLDRLCEVLMIRLLRHCMDHGLTQGGTLAGMSRARFALRFREVTGETPADYRASWRIMTAQDLLKSGRPLKHVADDVGYGSASALTRAFVRKLGCSPTEWLKGQRDAQTSM